MRAYDGAGVHIDEFDIVLSKTVSFWGIIGITVRVRWKTTKVKSHCDHLHSSTSCKAFPRPLLPPSKTPFRRLANETSHELSAHDPATLASFRFLFSSFLLLFSSLRSLSSCVSPWSLVDADGCGNSITSSSSRGSLLTVIAAS